MTTPRKHLINTVRNWASFLTPGDINLPDDFKIEYRGDLHNGCLISIKDPKETMPKYYEITIKEKIG